MALMIVDGQQGLTAADEAIAEWLRFQTVPVLLAVNKCESPQQGLAMAGEFWGLGLGDVYKRQGDRRVAAGAQRSRSAGGEQVRVAGGGPVDGG